MIDSMPMTVEMEISQEEWDKKTPEERDRILGKRQKYPDIYWKLYSLLQKF